MLKVLALISLMALGAFAAGDATFEATKRELNIPAIIMFFIFIVGTLGLTYWASKKQNQQAISILLVEGLRAFKMV